MRVYAKLDKLLMFLCSTLMLILCFFTGGINSPFILIFPLIIFIISYVGKTNLCIINSIYFELALIIFNYIKPEKPIYVHIIFFQLPLCIFSVAFGIYISKSIKKRYNNLLYLVNCLISTIEAKSPVTYMHTERVCVYCMKIGKALNLSKKNLALLKEASLLHDIGKLGIPDAILDKPEKLTDKEFEVIKNHPQKGYDILSKIDDLEPVANLVLCHHEKYDGSGYPNKLSGDDIPYLAKIITIADCFDVITSRRPYKDPSSIEAAAKELEKCKWTHFDGNIVDTFIKILKEDKDIPDIINSKIDKNII